MSDLLEGVTWFRQSSIRIRRDGIEIHVDPWGVTEESQADYILLTHPHYDNFSEEDISYVRGPHTVVVAPVTMKKQLGDVDHLMRPGDMVQLDGIDILAVPAYNLEKKFHTPEAGWLGYVFTLGGVTFYHAGHTDLLDSMAEVRCDVAFLPCCPDYSMGPDEVVKAGLACDAAIVVPIHWGDQFGTLEDALRVVELFPRETRILPRSSGT